MKNQDAHDWKNLVNNGLLPTVIDLKDYENKVKEGSDVAGDFFKLNPVTDPSPQDWLNAHKLMFHQVNPYAGQFRPPQIFVLIGGKAGADSVRIIPELELLKAQTTHMLKKANSSQEIMAAFAFCHARFEYIHPFNDGNGRAGRMILDAQIESVFGIKDRPELDRDKYLTGVIVAHANGHLDTLTNLLCEREGIAPVKELSVVSPYRMAPCMEDGKTYTLEQDLFRTHDFYHPKPVEKAPEQKKNPWKFWIHFLL